MSRAEIVERQAQWARFRAWEDGRLALGGGLTGEEHVRAVGEVIELYLEVSGGAAASAQRSVTTTVAAVRRLHHLLRAATPL